MSNLEDKEYREPSMDFFKHDWVKPYVSIPVGSSFHKVQYDNITIEFATFKGGVYLIDLFKDGKSNNSSRQECGDD